MHEVLAARRKDMTVEFNRGFVGMTEEPVTLDELRTTIAASFQAPRIFAPACGIFSLKLTPNLNCTG
jgi:hypothetical protein